MDADGTGKIVEMLLGTSLEDGLALRVGAVDERADTEGELLPPSSGFPKVDTPLEQIKGPDKREISLTYHCRCRTYCWHRRWAE